VAVTVDHQPLPAESLGLRTVGQVLSHLAKGNRLVVQVLIDGQEPDPAHLGSVRRENLAGHELFIETADARELATDALLHVEEQLKEADRLRVEASDLLSRGSHVKAMEKLSGCFSTWQHAQESVLKTGQLLRVDLSHLHVARGLTFDDLLAEFTAQLHEIKRSLERRDFSRLADVLRTDAAQTSDQWRSALRALREYIEA
jgi:hypothetical protein